MSQDQVDDLAERMEKMGETSFMDLPDEIHDNIFSFLDLPSRLKMRVNKRLDELQLRNSRSVKNTFKRIAAEMTSHGCNLTVCRSHTESDHEIRDLNQLERGIRRLAVNTFVNEVALSSGERFRGTGLTESLTEAFFNFEADRLRLTPLFNNFPNIRLSSLLAVAQKVKDVSIACNCNSLTAQDLCILRKTMLDGDCKLEILNVIVGKEVFKPFMESCFGVTIEDVFKPTRGTRIYRAADESIELYVTNSLVGSMNLLQITSNLITSIEIVMTQLCVKEYQFSFQKGGHEIPSWYRKIRLNHLYVGKMGFLAPDANRNVAWPRASGWPF